MDKQHYVVAGGTSGIGLAIAERLIGLGHSVTTISRRESAHDGRGISHLRHDFTSPDPLPEIAGAVDGLFYCPGSIFLKPLASISQEDLILDFKLNAVGAFNLVKSYKQNLQMGHLPGIVLFSSVAATSGLPFHASIAMAKGAVEGLTHALAAELAPSIRVNCIAPSLTDTPLAATLLNSEAKRTANAERHPLRRLGTAEEVADLAVFVMTKAHWMTSQIIGLNGGMGSLPTRQ